MALPAGFSQYSEGIATDGKGHFWTNQGQPIPQQVVDQYNQGVAAGQDMSWMLKEGGLQLGPNPTPWGNPWAAGSGPPDNPNGPVGPTPTPNPPPDVYDGGTMPPGGGTTQAPPLTGGPTGGPGGGSPFPEFTPPTYTQPPNYVPDRYAAPTYTPGGPFTAPGPFDFPQFAFDQFKAPTLDEAKNEPGYQFAMDQGRKALENSAAARGTLRTGGTLKDLFSWGDKFGEQNYGNVFNRAASTYDTNRNGAFTTWSANRDNAAANYATNYGMSKDTFTLNDAQRKSAFDTNALAGLSQFNVNATNSANAYDTNAANSLNAYDRAYQGAVASFNPKFESAKLSFEDLYRRWRDKLNATTSIATAGAQ